MGLLKSLLPGFLHQYTADGLTTVALLFEAIAGERMDDALRLLQTFLSTIPQCDNTDYEGHYQSLLYTIFSLLGMYVDVEVRTPQGRVDMVMRTTTTLYVVELKLNRTADIAFDQINLKNYPERFALCGLPVAQERRTEQYHRNQIYRYRRERSAGLLACHGCEGLYREEYPSTPEDEDLL